VKRPIPRLACLLALAACGSAESAPPPPVNGFAFGVFGDGPYSRREEGPFARMVEDVNRADLAWLIHVGDILGGPCSDELFRDRRQKMDSIRHPVIYTPGDNEWTDCHRPDDGGYDPLERLGAIRRTFFAQPGRSLGGAPMSVETQAADSAFREFPENTRWRRGGFVFATLHLVGSQNGSPRFPGRTAAHDAEVARRTAAAVAWLDAAFHAARASSARGVVLITHANVGLEPRRHRRAYAPFLDRLKQHVGEFSGPVLLIHGDSHTQRMDQPLRDANGRVYRNFTRLETFGSPAIGWVRVAMDTVAGRVAGVEPRRMR
jgi:hypothetical protein